MVIQRPRKPSPFTGLGRSSRSLSANTRKNGEMAERSKAAVLKTVMLLVGIQGSNPCLSAKIE